MVFRALFIFLLTSITTLLASQAVGQVFERLNQAAHFVATAGGCPNFDANRATESLRRLASPCVRDSQKTGIEAKALDLLKLQARVDENPEDQYFGLLGRQYVAELTCAQEFADQVANGNASAVKDLRTKTELLRVAKKRLVEANQAIQRNPRILTKTCPLTADDLKPNPNYPGVDLEYEACRELLDARAAYQTTLASLPLADVKPIKSFLENYSNAPENQALDGADLERELRRAYAQGSQNFSLESSRLVQSLSGGGAGLDPATRHALLGDPRLAAVLNERSGQDADFRGLACRADARFGSGRDALEMGTTVGSLLIGGVSSGIAKAGTWAFRLSRGAASAREAGLLSINASRLIQSSALAASVSTTGASIYSHIDQACLAKGPPLHYRSNATDDSRTCVSAPRVEQLAQDSCVLAMALSGLQGGAVAAIETKRLLKILGDSRPTRIAPIAEQNAAKVARAGAETKQVQSGIQSIRSVEQYGLPDDFRRSLEKTQGVQNLKAAFGRGKGLKFEITPTIEDANTLQATGGKGERIQADFIQKSLREIFPEAEFGKSGNVKLRVLDTAENDRARYLKTPIVSSVEMSDVKMANPGVGSLNRDETRRALGFSPDSKIVSLNNSVYNENSAVRELVNQISKTNPDAIIVNAAWKPAEMLELRKYFVRNNPSLKTYLMSQLDGSPIPKGPNVIVFNDTGGKMHAVYGVADVNVSAGAVNLAEPLLAKTPTVFFDHTSKFIESYDKKTFQQMARIATESGAQSIGRVEDLPGTLKKVISGESGRQIQTPYLVKPSASAPAPIEKLADDLQTQIFLQANNSEVLSRVSATQAGAQQYTQIASRSLNEISRSFAANDRLATFEATEKLASIRISPEIATRLPPQNFAEIQAGAQNVQKALQSAVTSKNVDYEITAVQLLQYEKNNPILLGLKPGEISSQTRALAQSVLNNPSTSAHVRPALAEALGSTSP